MASSSVPAPLLQNLFTAFQELASPDHVRDETQPPLEPPRVAIIGGSLGGCCAAIALSRIGCRVDVYERQGGQLTSQGAGLVIQPDMAAFLHEYDVCDVNEISVPSKGRQYIDMGGKVVGGDSNPQLFSAWDSMYRALRKKVPDSAYHSGKSVESVKIDNDEVAITISNGGGQEVTADLLIGADGPGSIVRATCSQHKQLTRSRYQGYVAWRGLLHETEAPDHVVNYLDSKFTVFQGENYHILAYVIPGPLGEVKRKFRRINWVWYCNVEEDSDELDTILTDIHGKRHGYSVPRGLLRPEVAKAQRLRAQNMLPMVLADMVNATDEIFIQAIHDMISPELAFGGKAALVGDAGCILRPHTAAGATQAAVNSWTLAWCLEQWGFQLGPALQAYSQAMVQVAKKLVRVGVVIGTRSQFPERVNDVLVEEGF